MHTQVIGLLSDLGADANSVNEGGTTPLMLAAMEGCDLYVWIDCVCICVCVCVYICVCIYMGKYLHLF